MSSTLRATGLSDDHLGWSRPYRRARGSLFPCRHQTALIVTDEGLVKSPMIERASPL